MRVLPPHFMMRAHTTASRACHTKAYCTRLEPFPDLQNRTSLANLHIKTNPVICNRSISTTHTTLYPRTTSPNKAEAESSCVPSCGQSLPPPSNCPPKCIQYVTGYYYYPYGYWFCGPYHVTSPSSGCGQCPCTPCLPSFPKCSCICPSCAVCINPSSANKQYPLPPSKPLNKRKPVKPRESNKLGLPGALTAFHTFHLKQQPKSHLGKVLPIKYADVPFGFKSKGFEGATSTGRSPDNMFPNMVLPKMYEFAPTATADGFQLESRTQLPTKYERDNPVFPSDGFSFSSMPKYNTPFPIPENGVDFHKVNTKARN